MGNTMNATTTRKTNRVSDVYGDQISVNGQWFHAERVFGKPAAQYTVGQLVDELVQVAGPLGCKAPPAAATPDELVSCKLYRGCSSNEMAQDKILAFVEVMLAAGGWGDFPLITGYIETLDVHDVEQCERLAAEDRTSVWLSEMGWSRLVSHADIGTRYVHIDNGHHRMAAAVVVSNQLSTILVPVADLRREESLPRFIAIQP